GNGPPGLGTSGRRPVPPLGAASGTAEASPAFLSRLVRARSARLGPRSSKLFYVALERGHLLLQRAFSEAVWRGGPRRAHARWPALPLSAPLRHDAAGQKAIG